MPVVSPANSGHLLRPYACCAQSHRLFDPWLTGWRGGGGCTAGGASNKVEVQKLPLALEGRKMLRSRGMAHGGR